MPGKREIQECGLKGVKWWGCCLPSSCGLRTFPEKTTFTSFLVKQLQLSQGPLPPSILPSSSCLSAGGSGGQLLSPCPWITACFSHILSTRRARTSGLGPAPVRSLAPCLDTERALVVKNPSANAADARDPVLIPGLGGSPGEGNGNPLQYSCLENSTDRGAWWATVHGVAKSRTQLGTCQHWVTLLSLKGLSSPSSHLHQNRGCLWPPAALLGEPAF